MSVSVLLAGLLMVWGSTHVTCLPDLSWDYTQHDVLLTFNETEVIEIKKTRYLTEDMPITCRQDVCAADYNIDPLRGLFNWPRTPMAYRVYLRCPYSFDEPKYAYRECLFDTLFIAAWSQNVVADDCPMPPPRRDVQTLERNISSTMDDNIRKFEVIYDIIQHFPYDRRSLDGNEVINVFNLTSFMIEHIASGSLPLVKLQEVINMIEFVLGETMLRSYTAAISSLLHQLTQLEQLLQQEADGNQFIMTSSNGTVVINMMKMRAHQIDSFHDDVTIRMPQGEFSDAWVTMMYFRVPLLVSLFEGVSGPVENATIPDNSEYDQQFQEHVPPSLINDTLPEYIFSELYNYDIIGGFMYINSSIRSNNSALRPIIINIRPKDDSLVQNGPVKCATSSEDATDANGVLLGNWYSYTDNKYCRELDYGEYATACSCQVHGFISVFIKQAVPDYHNAPLYDYPSEPLYDYPSEPLYDYPSEPLYDYHSEPLFDIDVFLGFPYVKELYVASHVFRAVSLVCLVLTILTFAVFGKTRRGRPTHILIQLCLSLIALLIVLYIAENISGTKLGCVAANVLRYYFILVSLLWNGVEGYNMYLKLVKVFDHNTHRLVTKAAVVAWGLPALMVTVIVAVDQRAFHGFYVECNFQCRLPDNILYYGYLLPMSVIILHNLAVFVLVIKALLKSSRAPIKAEQSKQTTPGVSWQQVYSAVAMLVLLGVPWMLSAFGAASNNAIDSLQTLEAVFQIVIIVCINLQGVFIFIFHCARNADVRQHWSSTLSRTKSSNVSDNA